MSTRPIREALEAMQQFSPHSADVRRAEVALKALAEIEEAAKALRDGHVTMLEANAEARAAAYELMESIAKDAP